jgi:hypothetical protein
MRNGVGYYQKSTLEPKSGLEVMLFNATFNNISVISWRSVLLVEEIGEFDRPTTGCQNQGYG